MLIIRWLDQACFLLWTLTGPHLLIDPPNPQAAAIVGQLHPRVILPMHYRTAALNPDLRAKLAPPDAFLARRLPRGKASVVRVSARDLSRSPRTLPKTPTIYLLRYE